LSISIPLYLPTTGFTVTGGSDIVAAPHSSPYLAARHICDQN
jgi:hypothetical protein